jgi:hypothetical protein
MKNHSPYALLLAVVALLLSAVAAFADGKMYYAEKVPATIPYQRALILHDEGIQTLVLQSQYEIPGDTKVRSLGWVVPVPAPPEVASMDDYHAEKLFNELDLRTNPVVTHLGTILLMVLIGSSLATVLLSFGWSFMIRNAVRQRKCVRLGRWAGVVFLVCLLVGPLFIKMKKGPEAIEVLSTRRVGIYAVQVVRASDAAELRAWLNANKFQYGADDEAAIQSYLDRKWCFVVAKTDPTTKHAAPPSISRGLVAPLILRFPSVNPIYPVALTATGQHPTEILIYLASNSPMTTRSPLTLRYSRAEDSTANAWTYFGLTDPVDFFDQARLDCRYLSKFKGTLTPAEMAQDIEFIPAPNAPDFRERRFEW